MYPYLLLARLTIVQEEVLRSLGYDGPESKYDMQKRIRRRYPVVHNAMKALEDMSMVQVIRREKGEKGHQKIIYDLTEFGLKTILAGVKELNFDRLARNQDGRGIVYLKEWGFLKSNYATDTAKKILRHVARYSVKPLMSRFPEPKAHAEHVGMYGLEQMMPPLPPEEVRRFELIQLLNESLAKYRTDSLEYDFQVCREYTKQVETKLRRTLEIRDKIKKARDTGMNDKEIERELLGEEQPRP
jgi:DNA-binding PadR family transcriptional regulator